MYIRKLLFQTDMDYVTYVAKQIEVQSVFLLLSHLSLLFISPIFFFLQNAFISYY